jgi:hypothetical protein
MKLHAALAAALVAAASSLVARADEPGPAAKPPAAKASAPKGSPGKPRAPVRVEAGLAAGAAHLTLHFEGAGKDVSVRVYGVRGLAVTSEERPVTGASFAAGDVKELDVRFTAPEGLSHLAVQVSGTFAGGPRSTVQSFAVGEPSPAQKQESAHGSTRTPAGEQIKALPAQEK